ncbi:MAG: hypothetical protein CMH26_00810 [Micavibrio sp.]|nr:hypothetical protein [Micavibrio sp.]
MSEFFYIETARSHAKDFKDACEDYYSGNIPAAVFRLTYIANAKIGSAHCGIANLMLGDIFNDEQSGFQNKEYAQRAFMNAAVMGLDEGLRHCDLSRGLPLNMDDFEYLPHLALSYMKG